MKRFFLFLDMMLFCLYDVPMNITTLSSNHFSVDLQVLDVLNFLEVEHPEVFEGLTVEFPEVCNVIMDNCWFDVDAMGVDVEWSSWLIDAIENSGVVWWDEGEPWGVVPGRTNVS